jgi:hypothetical protein
MGILSNTKELKEDVLFRASEPLVGSKWDTKVIGYLNRCYRTLATGASEFLPEYVEDWWWLRGTDVLNLDPVYSDGGVNLTKNSTAVTFNPAPPDSLVGRRLVMEGFPDIPIISAHVAGNVSAVIDKPWTGDDIISGPFEAMKTVYTLSTAVQVITGPMSVFRDHERIHGMSPERMNELYPLARLSAGVPAAFCLETETQIRFSHGGDSEGDYIRVEYNYRPKVVDLTDNLTSIPLVPAQWMHLLTDMALVYMLLDKNDDRSNAVALAARTGLGAMLKENRRRSAKVDATAGKIITRQDKLLSNRGKPYPTL